MVDNFLKELFSFVKDLKSNPAIIMLTFLMCFSVFVIWQLTNHIPTQLENLDIKIDRLDTKLNTKIDSNHKEVRQDIYKLLIEIKDK